MSINTISIAEAKMHISELVAKSQHSKQRFILTRRAKPVAALVSLEDLKWLEQREERQGLAAIVGCWQHTEELDEVLSDLHNLRNMDEGERDVSI